MKPPPTDPPLPRFLRNPELLLVWLGVPEENILDGVHTLFRNIREVKGGETLLEIDEERAIQQRLSNAYDHAPTPFLRGRATKLKGCHQSFMLFLKKSSANGPPALVIPYACDQRCCPLCSRSRSVETLIRTATTVGRVRQTRRKYVFITLTHQNAPAGGLQADLDLQAKAWSNFRKSLEWKSHVEGYLWAAEISYNSKSRSWHPHIHILAHSSYWPKNELRATWRKIAGHQDLTADSHIDGIDTTDTNEWIGALKEITKYVMKPFESKGVPDVIIWELTNALRRRRTKGTAGSLTIPGIDRDRESDYVLSGGLDHVQKILEAWPDKELAAAMHSAIWRDFSIGLRVATSYEPAVWMTPESSTSI